MFTISGFYKFKKINFLKKHKTYLENEISNTSIRGSIIISSEGINGSLAGNSKDISKILKLLKKEFKFTEFDSSNISTSRFQPFHKAKVKVKKEVVPLGLKIKSESKRRNRYLSGKSWNNLIIKKETLLIDVRKPFEYSVGTFKNAMNPNIQNFRDFPKFLNKIEKTKPVAMFCTGGIRCEKASIFLKKKGFKNVFQLKGVILNYLNKTKKKDSLWKGECFVFDNRISLKHGLKVGSYSICSGCRKPISLKDKKSKKYEEGVSCPNCHDNLTDNQKSRFRMRQKQINLAKEAGKRHIFQKEY